MGKALCGRPFALHRQKPEKHKQNVNVVPPLEKFLRTPMERGLEALSIGVLTKVFRSLLSAIRLNRASASWG